METTNECKLLLRCFGAFEALQSGVPVRGLELRESDRLLAFLALRANRLVPTVPIAEALWPETGSLDSLHQSTRQVRLALGEDAVRMESQKGFLRLNLDGAEADIVTFQKAIAQGTVDALETAVKLHSAPLLELWDDGWVRGEREKLRGQYLSALKTLAAACREQGDHAAASAYLRLFMKIKPSEEWVWRELMVDLVRSGERYQALKLYEQARETVFKRLEPPEDMTRLAHEIQRTTVGNGHSPAGSSQSVHTAGPAIQQPSDPHYVMRPADQRLSDAVARFESVILLQGPAQTGKTSLLAKGLEQARMAGASVVQSDLRRLSTEEMATADSFYRALAYAIAEQLSLDDPPNDSWNPRRSPNANFEGYVRKSVLKELDTPLVWGLDEIDRLFERPYGIDVFALFRAWHNARSLDPGGPWKHLTLVLAYSTEAQLFITDLNQSPFNVGIRVTLTDFTLSEVGELNKRFGSPLKTDAVMSRFYNLVAGHPYLSHVGLREMANQSIGIDDFERQADREDGLFGSHLRRLRSLLSRDESLSCAVRDLIAGGSSLSEETFYRLRAAGAISGETERHARIRCPLYARYLERRLP